MTDYDTKEMPNLKLSIRSFKSDLRLVTCYLPKLSQRRLARHYGWIVFRLRTLGVKLDRNNCHMVLFRRLAREFAEIFDQINAYAWEYAMSSWVKRTIFQILLLRGWKLMVYCRTSRSFQLQTTAQQCQSVHCCHNIGVLPLRLYHRNVVRHTPLNGTSLSREDSCRHVDRTPLYSYALRRAKSRVVWQATEMQS